MCEGVCEGARGWCVCGWCVRVVCVSVVCVGGVREGVCQDVREGVCEGGGV